MDAGSRQSALAVGFSGIRYLFKAVKGKKTRIPQ